MNEGLHVSVSFFNKVFCLNPLQIKFWTHLAKELLERWSRLKTLASKFLSPFDINIKEYKLSRRIRMAKMARILKVFW